MEPLAYAHMQRALVGAVAVGVLCAVLGTFVILKNLAFIGEGLAHGSLPGLAVGYALGYNLTLSAGLFTLGLALVIGYVTEKSRVALDTAIGILFSASMALGIVIISLARGFTPDLTAFLFGNVLAIGPSDLWLILLVSLVVLTAVAVLFRPLVAFCFDRELAVISGLPASRLYYLLLAMIAAAVVVSLQAVGMVLVTAFLVIPPAAAFQLTNRFRPLIALAVLLSTLGSVTGLFLSYYLNIASGATIVLTQAVLFLLCALFGRRRPPLVRSLGLGHSH